MWTSVPVGSEAHETDAAPGLVPGDDVQRFERQGYAARRFNLRV